MFEKMSLVERERQLDDCQDGDQHDRKQHHGRRLFDSARHPLRQRGGELTQPMRAARQQQDQQQDAGDRRPSEVGAPAQPVVASRFVFVQTQ